MPHSALWLRPILLEVPPAHDVGCTAVTSPPEGSLTPGYYNVTGTIENFGLNSETFDADASDVSTLVDTVQNLYDNMDQSLRFQPVTTEGASEPGDVSAAETADDEVAVDREADFRGVVCPLNYVKTKLLLEQMSSGQVLSILLDEAGGRNVPESASHDGHEVLSQKKEGEHWRVILRKA